MISPNSRQLLKDWQEVPPKVLSETVFEILLGIAVDQVELCDCQREAIKVLEAENQELKDALKALCYPSRTSCDRDGSMIGWFNTQGPNAAERTLNARKLIEPKPPKEEVGK